MASFGKAIGYWNIKVGEGADIDVKPVMQDIRKLRKIFFKKENQSNRGNMIDEFIQWIITIIKRDNPAEKVEDIELYCETYAMDLLENAMIVFKFTSEEELEKSRTELAGDVQKKILDN